MIYKEELFTVLISLLSTLQILAFRKQIYRAGDLVGLLSISFSLTLVRYPARILQDRE